MTKGASHITSSLGIERERPLMTNDDEGGGGGGKGVGLR